MQNYDLNRTEGKDLKSIYVRLTEDQMLGSHRLGPPRLCIDTSKKLSRYFNMSANFVENDYEVLNILEETLDGSKNLKVFFLNLRKDQKFSESGLRIDFVDIFIPRPF